MQYIFKNMSNLKDYLPVHEYTPMDLKFFGISLAIFPLEKRLILYFIIFTHFRGMHSPLCNIFFLRETFLEPTCQFFYKSFLNDT